MQQIQFKYLLLWSLSRWISEVLDLELLKSQQILLFYYFLFMPLWLAAFGIVTVTAIVVVIVIAAAYSNCNYGHTQKQNVATPFPRSWISIFVPAPLHIYLLFFSCICLFSFGLCLWLSARPHIWHTDTHSHMEKGKLATRKTRRWSFAFCRSILEWVCAVSRRQRRSLKCCLSLENVAKR